MVRVKYKKSNSSEPYRVREFAHWGLRAQLFALAKSFVYGDMLIEETTDERY